MTVDKVREITYDYWVEIAVVFLTLIHVIGIFNLILWLFFLRIFGYMAEFSWLSYNL